MNTLKAEKRDMSIKAKKLRREGFVTGCIFGREMKESIPLKMEKADVEKLLKVENKGGQVMLEVDGQTYDALIKEVDYNPLKGYVDEIDFQALVSNEKVHSVAEIHLVNLDKLAAGVPQQMLQEISRLKLKEKRIIFDFYIHNLKWERVAERNAYSERQCKNIRDNAPVSYTHLTLPTT